ncbi:uncharacterized protein LOC125280751 isoform X2 [Megalobrama amblycephala]|uniref:uncharacterized protein LOC125249145 isoform X3 n=1 Tax=Megalobrama amblycephala TaxID=75352 RepID=UPI0020144DAF|nr:uncharacterized protein LOC125249145 isoform X3 [Megalobrama amblycephala]XP_048017317.1 uncharacterized protein LOC125249145 isoform X4 [Megalobrama amblycephala]XP_048023324.1 uncharacterized protein LOC125253420 isoform X2 [Megalobrama amblycephala]XP_048035839.1 uncharacterized protein LOC125261313 isoform X2 [Megalobrama amblycephala]XP_048036573.1 uncharacterized protein LOC125262057 isoform X2 [Megalobrama amblycephala]XP_048067457.1 uncharacterized protein LOC125280751 isoform X2 [M
MPTVRNGAFPGLFKARKSFIPTPKKRPARSMPIQFFLLNKSVKRTPKASEELILLQAGLGRRTVAIPEDADHSEISKLLLETYSKMESLEGAWMLYKAVGGSGQRKLNVVAPEAEGYTGSYLIKTVGGKGCLYIMPIQNTLDISPLPYSSKEFEKMPKARCVKCHTDMPVQLLAVHVQKCETDIWINSSDSESEPIDFLLSSDTEVPSISTIVDEDNSNDPGDPTNEEVASTSTELNRCSGHLGNELDSPSVVMDAKVSCPVCSAMYSEDFIEVHASTCGERADDRPNQDLDITGQKQDKQKSLTDAINTLKKAIDPSTIFSLCVTREDMFSRGLTQWKRQKKSSPKNPLRVTFIGEPGIDSGALMKEFLTEMMAGIEEKFFEGGSTGKNLKYSITDFQNDNLRIVGEIMAVSITQDGPPPNFFMEWIYNFISSGEIKKDELTKADITDADLLDLIDKIETADTTALLDLSERIVACGYTGPLTCDRKEEIVSAVVLHSSVRILPMLQQMCRGLELYGLHEMVKQNQPLFQPLFVPGHFTKPDADFLMMALSPILSEVGSVKRQRESRIVNYLQDFIQSLEDEEEGSSSKESRVGDDSEQEDKTNCTKGDAEQDKITVSSFMQWITGQGHVPITSAQREKFKIHVEFDHDCQLRYGQHSLCFPLVNACSCTVTLPTQHLGTNTEFLGIMRQAVSNSREFGRS